MTLTLFDRYKRNNPPLFKPVEDRAAFEDLRHYLSIYDLRLPQDFMLNVSPIVSKWFAHQSTYIFPVSGYPEIELAQGYSTNPYSQETFTLNPTWARELFKLNRFDLCPLDRASWIDSGKPAGGWNGANLTVVDIVKEDNGRLCFKVAPTQNKWIDIHLDIFQDQNRGFSLPSKHEVTEDRPNPKDDIVSFRKNVEKSDWAARQLHVSTVMLFVDNDGDLAIALQRRGKEYRGGDTFHTGASAGGVEPLSSYEVAVDMVEHSSPILTNTYLIKSYANENGEELGIEGAKITPVCMVLENCIDENYERPGFINVCSVLAPEAGGNFSEGDIRATLANYFRRDDKAPETTGLGIVKIKDLVSSMSIANEEVDGRVDEVLVISNARVLEKSKDGDDLIATHDNQRLVVKFAHAQILAFIASPSSILGARFKQGANIPLEFWPQ